MQDGEITCSVFTMRLADTETTQLLLLWLNYMSGLQHIDFQYQ